MGLLLLLATNVVSPAPWKEIAPLSQSVIIDNGGNHSFGNATIRLQAYGNGTKFTEFAQYYPLLAGAEYIPRTTQGLTPLGVAIPKQAKITQSDGRGTSWEIQQITPVKVVPRIA